MYFRHGNRYLALGPEALGPDTGGGSGVRKSQRLALPPEGHVPKLQKIVFSESGGPKHRGAFEDISQSNEFSLKGNSKRVVIFQKHQS